MVRSTLVLTPLAAWLLMLPAGLHAQTTDFGEGGYAADSIAFHDASEGKWPGPRAAAAGESLHGLASLGSAAWPTVRAYLWETCFEGYALFAGYAVSLPGQEDDRVLTFLLMIDRDVWNATDVAVRQATLHEASEAFRARLDELALEGTVEVVLQSH